MSSSNIDDGIPPPQKHSSTTPLPTFPTPAGLALYQLTGWFTGWEIRQLVPFILISPAATGTAHRLVLGFIPLNPSHLSLQRKCVMSADWGCRPLPSGVTGQGTLHALRVLCCVLCCAALCCAVLPCQGLASPARSALAPAAQGTRGFGHSLTTSTSDLQTARRDRRMHWCYLAVASTLIHLLSW